MIGTNQVSFHQTAKFKALNKKWRDKLENSGFSDAEDAEGNLKRHHKQFFGCRVDMELAPSREAYYRLAEQFLHVHSFKNANEHKVWELYSQGWFIPQINKHLGWNRLKAEKVVKRLKEEMFKWAKIRETLD